MSTKYERPSGAYAGSSGLSNRSKYQDDAAATPKVAISSSKMDGDMNYVIDALNDIDEASGSQSSIAERLDVVMNADGTLKASVTASVDEWTADNATGLVRVDDTSVRVDGDQTARYTAGRRIRLTVSGSYVYADVASSTYASTQTTISCINIAGASTVISTNPTVLAYSPSTTGSSGNSTRVQDGFTVRGSTPLVRLKKTGGSEYGMRVNGTDLELVENTGTEATPTWQARGTVNSSGLTPGDGTVTTAKMAAGTANTLLGFDAAGTATELTFGTLMPTGSVLAYAASSAPSGFLLCNGAAVSRTTYAALFAVVGTTFGVGDGSTTFNLPDLRGRSVFGVDSSAGRLTAATGVGVTGGSETKSGTTDGHTLTESEIPSHTHDIPAASGSNDSTGSFDTARNGGTNTTMASNATGGGQAHSHDITDFDVIPPYLALSWIIRT